MKQIIFIFVLMIAADLHAQNKSTIPNVIKSSFATAFPNSTKVKWGKEDKDYEADFVQGGKKMSALFDASGKLKETESSISKNELPANAIPYFNQHYTNVAIKETAKITKAGGEINFEIGTKGKDILFDTAGNFIKEVKD
ncbi:MAG: PepSY-like domain-containing protein [Bacteroidota bacterium]|nr:PepSY-like domain-containing protein [Bacteroidota bacterium]